MRKQRNANRRSIYFIGFVLILMIGIGAVQITSSYNKNSKLEGELVRLQNEKEALQREQIELNRTIHDMDSRAFVEKMARTKFGLIYPNEILIDTSEQD